LKSHKSAAAALQKCESSGQTMMAQAGSAIDAARSGLIVLQFEQVVGVRAEARREIYHCWRVIKPIPAGILGSAAFASLQRGCIPQTQSRQNSLSLPKTPSAGVTATTESEHDCD
jgi:hypothetical protein